MKIHRLNRRMFLQGAGQTLLSIPFLTSLMPRETWAAGSGSSASPLRFLMFTNHGSPSERGFYGQYFDAATTASLQRAEGNQLIASLGYRPLSQMTGDMSYILSPLTKHKSRLSILRGIDSMSLDRGAHPSSTASAGTGFGTTVTTFSGQLSIDTLIAQKLTPVGTPIDQMILNLNPSYAGGLNRLGSFTSTAFKATSTFTLSSSYNGQDMSRSTVKPSLYTTASILSRFFSTGSAQEAELIDRRGVIDSVMQDYQRIRVHKNIGAEDRRKLDTFIAYLSDVETAIARGPTNNNCSAPTGLENDFPPPVLAQGNTETAAAFQARYTAATQKWLDEKRDIGEEALKRNHAKLIAAAFACDIVKVASIALHQVGSHVFHHSAALPKVNETSSADAKVFFDAHKETAATLAMIMSTLDAVQDGSGTLLDNTLIYWNQNYGCVPATGGAHSNRNFPVVLAGGAQGKLNLGYYIDYRFKLGAAERGLPINNLLVTLMNCFGVGPSDYEFKSNQGYGTYDGLGLSMPTNVTNIVGKRSVLPFLSAA